MGGLWGEQNGSNSQQEAYRIDLQMIRGCSGKFSGSICEQSELRQELKSITERIDQMDMREMCIREFMGKAKSYMEMPELTPELLRVFIRRIEVYEKFEKYSRTCGNLIVIHYAFQMSEQNGMPALEQVMHPIQQTA